MVFLLHRRRQVANTNVISPPPPPHACIHVQLGKQGSIVATLMAMVAMSYVPTILYRSMGTLDSSRYGLLAIVVFRIAGVGVQLALFTVLLKWVLAGVRAGVLCFRQCNDRFLCSG